MLQREIELLAPARTAEIAISAINHGADAIYIGAPTHGARSSAANSIKDIARVVDYAHPFNVKVYATVNTIIYENELRDVETMIGQLYRIGVDALIVQDMSILRMDIPPIALHASTQCDIRTVDKARFLADVGFSQLVLPREFSLEEIADVHKNVDVPLEAFIHGALCVSYSGACHASCLTMRRSANRGECAQICRLPYDLCDKRGNILVKNKHLLSLRDLNRSNDIEAMMDAGISSFKIEGRLKDEAYVKNIVALYRQKIDVAIANEPQKYKRASSGESKITFEPTASKSFNRGFTSYFLHRPTAKTLNLASADTPKWRGEPIGKVISSNGKKLVVRLDSPLHNGDGIGFFNASGSFDGFRINKATGSDIFLAEKVDIKPNTPLFRNYDKQWDDELSASKAVRRIKISLNLRTVSSGIALEATDDYGHYACHTLYDDFDPASTPQIEQHTRILRKTGETIFEVSDIKDETQHLFIPASILTALRRQTLEKLMHTIKVTYRYSYRNAESKDAKVSTSKLTRYDNVANSLAEAFYSEHGATDIEPAMELPPRPTHGQVKAMTSRYCIRRESGRCLSTPNGKEWPNELYLRSDSSTFRLEFDCKNCVMNLYWLAHNVNNN